MSVWEVVGVAILAGVLPALALLQLPLLSQVREERMALYGGSAITILLMGVGVILLTLPSGARIETLGLTFPGWGAFLGWTAVSTAGGLALVAASRPLVARYGGENSAFIRMLIPRTPGEKVAFSGLSLAAGTGEELAYRGYLWGSLQLLGMGPWAATLLAALPFGVLHAYQGPVGVVRTGLMGVVLTLPVLFTGSLLPAMAAHFLLDLLLGLVLADHFLEGGEDATGSTGPFSEPTG